MTDFETELEHLLNSANFPPAQPPQESEGGPAPIVALPATLPPVAPGLVVEAMESAECLIAEIDTGDDSVDLVAILSGIRRARAGMLSMYLALKSAKPFVGYMAAEAPDPIPAQITMRMFAEGRE